MQRKKNHPQKKESKIRTKTSDHIKTKIQSPFEHFNPKHNSIANKRDLRIQFIDYSSVHFIFCLLFVRHDKQFSSRELIFIQTKIKEEKKICNLLCNGDTIKLLCKRKIFEK